MSENGSWLPLTGAILKSLTPPSMQRWSEMFYVLMPLSLSQGCQTDAKVRHNLVTAHNPDWHCIGGILYMVNPTLKTLKNCLTVSVH